MKKESEDKARDTKSFIKFNLLIALLCGLLLLAFFVSSFFPKSRLWGINHLAYFPLWVRLLFTILGLSILIPYLNSKIYNLLDQILSFFQNFFAKKRVLSYSFLSLVFMFLFWLLRTRMYFLGDGYAQISFLKEEQYTKTGFEALEIFAHLYLYKFLKLFITPAAESIYVGMSIFAGGVFVFLLFFLSKALSEDITDRLLIFSILIFSGATQLFLGYAEHYTLTYVSIFAYLYFSLRYLEGKARIYLPVLFCALSAGFHFSSAYLLPSLFFLLALKRKKEEFVFSKKRALPYLLVLVFLLVLSVFYIWSFNPVLSEIFVPLLKGRVYVPDYTLFSFPHILDIINQHLLLSPVGIILLVSLVIAFKDRLRSKKPLIPFLVIVSLGQLFYHFVVDPKLGAGRDWDLISNVALGYTLLAVYLFMNITGPKKYSTVLLTFSAFLTILPWILLNNNTQSGIDRFKNLLDLDAKRSRSGLYLLSGYYGSHNKFKEAREVTKKIFEQFPEDSLTRAASAFAKLGDYDRATQLLEEAIKIMPSYLTAYNDLGWIYFNQGKLDKALEEFQVLVRLNPFNATYHGNLGKVLLKKGVLKEALAELKKATKLGKAQADVYSNIAFIYVRLEAKDKAIEAYKKAIQIDPGFFDAYYGLGGVYLERNSLDEALAEFYQAANLKPGFAPTYFALGLTCSRMGFKEKAIENYELFLRYSKDEAQNEKVRGLIQQLHSKNP
jgi:tetratricopeptide (TPR) repeat protein